ncbi:hypothetical protein Acr_11g0016220 [Actinidia rufa]|uniref:Pentatricopeptide repeat-containing protein At1g16830 n=1 Tax=Actinidia rufa TaxID=165716 RepID=A0A7J0FFS9_9ERIC|nr:hypothetical protein Acr_11g0016220 [Actinidia rufa]
MLRLAMEMRWRWRWRWISLHTASKFVYSEFWNQTHPSNGAFHSTQLPCPSDLIALTFFFWCARQPDYYHDRVAFDHMVNVVARLAQQLRIVKNFIKLLEGVGCVTKPQTFLLLLRIFWHGGMNNLVFEAFEEMSNCGYIPNTYTRNIVMDVLFKIGRVDLALRMLNEIHDPNFLTFSIGICNLCKINDFKNIQNVLRKMLRMGYYPNAGNFSMVVNCFCKSGKLAEALQLLGLMISLGIPTSVSVWSILIDGFCKSGKLVMACNLLERMVETGCSPNVVTCTSLIKGFMKSQMPDRALRILSTMDSKGYSPDLILCNVLIDCFSKIGRYDDALDVFCSFPKRKLVPDSYTLCSIISVVCMSRQYDLLPLLISGLAIQADLVVCNSLLIYFCRAGYPSGAVELYNDMIDRGFIPDRYSYAGLLSGLCGMGRIGEAVNVYRAIVRNHFCLDPHIHTIVIDGLISSGNYHRAIRLFRKAVVEKYPLDVVSYTLAIHGLFRGARTEEACSLFSQMKAVGVAPNANTYNTMLSGFCRERDIKMVRQILHEMIDADIGLDYNVFYMIKKLLFRSWYSHSAFNLFVEMCKSEMIPDKTLAALLLKGLTLAVKVSGNLADIPDVDTSSSDDMADVAASVG